MLNAAGIIAYDQLQAKDFESLAFEWPSHAHHENSQLHFEEGQEQAGNGHESSLHLRLHERKDIIWIIGSLDWAEPVDGGRLNRSEKCICFKGGRLSLQDVTSSAQHEYSQQDGSKDLREVQSGRRLR